MLRAAILLAIGLSAGAALAQTGAPQDGRFIAQWEARPGAASFERNYPRAARNREIQSIVQLCCAPREDRTLDCRAGFEWPQHMGFGDATVRLGNEFRMTPESYAAFKSQPGAWLQVPIRWSIAGVDSPAFDEAAHRISEGTLGLCRPTAASQTP